MSDGFQSRSGIRGGFRPFASFLVALRFLTRLPVPFVRRLDPLGHRLTMAQLYPWPFDPDYLGEAGYMPDTVYADRTLGTNGLTSTTAARLLAAAQRAHAPYSKCPAAIVLTLRDGGHVTGFAIESVAFNPTMGPLQAALINLSANGYPVTDIASAALATKVGGDVDYSASTGELFGKVAPGVPLRIVDIT